METERLRALYKELEYFLNHAPIEDDCTDTENDMYCEMANLKEAIEKVFEETI